jgi:hypothetical protein
MTFRTPAAATATNSPAPSPQVISEKDAAVFVGMSTAFLKSARLGKGSEGPSYIRMGRSIRYRISDLELWLDSRLVQGRRAARK